jgi:hypothetical protein
MDEIDVMRIRASALNCIKDEFMAILDIAPIEMDGKVYALLPGERLPEIKRRVLSYFEVLEDRKK